MVVVDWPMSVDDGTWGKQGQSLSCLFLGVEGFVLVSGQDSVAFLRFFALCSFVARKTNPFDAFIALVPYVGSMMLTSQPPTVPILTRLALFFFWSYR